MSRRFLQGVNALMAIRRVILATLSLVYGAASPVYQSASLPTVPALDSNLRFFGGMSLGLGLVMLWLTPSIEARTGLFRAAWACAFLGGVGRVVSIASVGTPPMPMLVAAVVETVAAPFMIWWQHRVARSVAPDPR